MAVEETTTRIDDGNSGGSDTIRKVVAAIVGLIVIILIVLLAKWLGDRIRERFFENNPPVVETIPPEDSNESTPSGKPIYDPKTGTYSAIPATGPNDFGYAMIGFLAVAGLSSLVIAKKFSIS